MFVVRDAVSVDQLKQWYWDEERSVPEIAKSLGVSKDHLYQIMRLHGISRRNYTQSNYVVSKAKPQFCVKASLSQEDEKLKTAGIMLYWGEGAQRGGTVDFSNSNPEMVLVFLKFLREICGAAESRLRIYLYHHGNSEEVEASRIFWNQATGIPLAQFSRPYIPSRNTHKSSRIMRHGLIHIRYSDKRLLKLIQLWIGEYVVELERAGTRVVKWARL